MSIVLSTVRIEDPSFVFLVFRALMDVFWFFNSLCRGAAAIFVARS
jgi:hypothetical protein